jgi:pre-rRNA-processing protein TSR4
MLTSDRYELDGTPLPFSSDAVFDALFPPPKTTTIVGKDMMVQPVQRRTFTAESLPVCPMCQASRVFECQLMPNLINVLRTATDETATDEERRKALEAAVGKGRGGMEWGTCLVFSCSNNCCGSAGTKQTWAEEVVLVQWDD